MGKKKSKEKLSFFSRRRCLFIFGTRPEAIKLAPVIKELEKDKKRFLVKICVTAQHRDMLDMVLETFYLQPDFDLGIMREGQTLFDINVRVLRGLEKILKSKRPDLVFVQGDTTTAFVSALASFYCQIPVAHIEAGLRTLDKYAPFPEEMNRRLISHLADYHFAPTKKAKDNLLREGIKKDQIIVTGNTVIDALYLVLKLHPNLEVAVLQKVNPKNRIILVTCHRRESFGKPFERICSALARLAERNKDIEIIYPVHPNPNIRIPAHKILGGRERIHLIPPMEYLPFAYLLKSSYIILTDSGGIQEEAPALGKPVLVLREKTERPEAILAGTARLVGTDEKKIVAETERLLHCRSEYLKMAKVKNPFGDGKASERIRKFLVARLT